MIDPLNEQEQRGGRWVIGVFVALVVGYPLSIGPMNFLYTLSGMGNQHPIGNMLQVLYEPLFWIARSTGMMPLLERYVDWWAF